MIRVAIVYFTNTDVTGRLVRATANGMKKQGARVFQHRITGADIVDGRFREPSVLDRVTTADAVIFATPTYMGGPAAQFKAFADASSSHWTRQAWAGKVAAGITCGSGLNGDQSGTLHYLATLAAQHGMAWIGLDAAVGYHEQGLNRLGCQLGVVAQSADGRLHETDRASAVYLGQRLLNFTNRLNVCESIAQPKTMVPCTGSLA